MAIDLLARKKKEPIDLLARNSNPESLPEFESLSPEDQQHVIEMTKQQASQQNPNMPDWLRDMLLQITPKNRSPILESAARGVSNVTNYIPAAAGGLLQGASIPIRGVASTIPTEFTQNLANSPDLRNLFPEAIGNGQKSIQLASELAGGGGLFGKMLQGAKALNAMTRMPSALQTPFALAETGYLATPGTPSNKAIGAGGALAGGGIASIGSKAINKAGSALPEFIKGLTSRSTPEQLVQAVQKPHDVLSSTADELYGQVRNAINKRNVKIPIKKEFLNQAREYFPKNKSSVNDLFKKAEQGDYEAIHKIQSSLYKKGTKQLSGDDLVKENEGEEIIDLRDRMNDFLEKHLIKEGHVDVAHVLRQGKKTYKQIMDTYYAPNLRKDIGKMVQHELRLIPENPEKLFNQNSVPMKNFLEKHPDVAKHAAGIKNKKEALSFLKKSLIASGLTGGTLAGGKSIIDLFK